MEPVCKKLNLTNFKLLIWNPDPLLSEGFGLRNVDCVNEIALPTHGGKQKFKMYVYAKKAMLMRPLRLK